MRKWYLFPALLLCIILANSCQKEYSFEGGFTEAEGTLQSELTGECLPKTVAGLYEATVALTDSNYIDVTVNVSVAGQYTISTDTLNGMYFSGTGRLTAIGQNTVRLRGTGTPLTEGTDNFVVSFGTSTCTIAVITLPEGAGGPAEYTFTGAPGDCQTPTITGTYIGGVALTSNNTIELTVNVTTIGTYNITTEPVNGMTFSGTGTLGTTGANTVTLVGSGTPAIAAPSEFAVPGTQSCTFTINVAGPASFTVDCSGSAFEGEYQVGLPLDPNANFITLIVDVQQVGAYSISGTVNGMTFSAVGEFLPGTEGTNPVILQGTGNPTTPGSNPVPITGGQATCDVNIDVDAAPVSSGSWSFVEGGVTYSGQGAGATLDVDMANNVASFEFDGDNTASQELFIQLLDVTGGTIVGGETYNTAAANPTLNFALFNFDGPGIEFTADPFSTPPPPLLFTITQHNTATKYIKGTFAGIVKDAGDVEHTITNGNFEGFYQ